MNTLIAGASGFIGTELVNHLSKNQNITVLGRDLEKLELIFPKNIHKLTWNDLNNYNASQYDLIINLSGSNIGAKRWSKVVKEELIQSRTTTNQRLVEWLLSQKAKPRFFSASAVGIYGTEDVSSDSLDENTPLPLSSDDFLQQIGLVWEESLKTAIDAEIPVTTLRFGVVLKRKEGMLKKLELPFRLGLGSILGSGKQSLSWIHYKDLINAIDFLIQDRNLTGPFNITSPYPITQQEFTQQLAKALKRPLLFKTPELLIKIFFGEMGEYLLLKGQKVIPKRLNELGFKFTYPEIGTALVEEFAQ